VQNGRVKVAEIDAAVRQVLTLKFEAGLFEHPTPSRGGRSDH